MISRYLSPAETMPALVVTHGNTANKHRPLKGDTMVLGRARGCDLRLEAPDISDVHAVIVRRPDGLHIRDCNSRTGIRLNGAPVRDAMLRDGDTLQVGLFSFQVLLPGGADAASTPIDHLDADAEPLLRLRRSRHRLAERALALRRRLREERAGRQSAAEQELAERRSELERVTEALQSQLLACDQRGRALDEAEREISRDRALLDQERAELEEARQRLADQQAEWSRQRLAFPDPELEEQQTKERERYLLGTRLELGPEDGGFSGDAVNGHGSATSGDEALASPAATAQAVLQVEAVRSELQKELDALRVENERLQEALAEQAEEPTQQVPWVTEIEQLRGQIAGLKEQLREKDAQIADLPRRRQEMEQEARAQTMADIEKYEAELNQFRRQLETDRQELDEEMRLLQERQAELEETVKNEELQLSRERAQLARERVQLDQMRDTIRMDIERSGREGELRKRLASLQRPRG
jgi:pSer/pThr/pTyr-binding forkhead associated (FHA) protein